MATMFINFCFSFLPQMVPPSFSIHLPFPEQTHSVNQSTNPHCCPSSSINGYLTFYTLHIISSHNSQLFQGSALLCVGFYGSQRTFPNHGRMLRPRVVNLPVNRTSDPIQPGPHYNLNLESITINGQMSIDREVFITSSNKGAIIDSGTTMAHFVEGAYNPIVDAITRTIPQSIGTTDSNGFRRYSVATSVLSVNDLFPPLSLNFANNASLVLRPQDYLLPFPTFDGRMWCLGFH